jgi:hypothetical protein
MSLMMSPLVGYSTPPLLLLLRPRLQLRLSSCSLLWLLLVVLLLLAPDLCSLLAPLLLISS